MRVAWIVAGVLATSGCGPESGGESICPNSPAFVVRVAADPGPMPRHTTLTVTYGGGDEVYPLVSPPERADVLFCHPDERDDGEGGIASLSCEVWTQSTTSLHVAAEGYSVLEEELQVDRDEHGCLRTRDVSRTLQRVDPIIEG